MEETQSTPDSSFAAPADQKDWPAKNHIGPGQWSKIQRKYHLSRREIDVCKAMCRGCNDKQVAEILGIAKGTVDGHVHSIYLKVGVHSKIKLLLTFLEI